MNLKNVLKPDRMLLGVDGTDQELILKRLIQPFINDDVIADSEVFLADLLRREAEITTVMDNGVAIPHARSHTVKRLALVVGISGGDGVAYDSETGVLCHLFFCIAIPSFAPTAHLPLLKLLAAFARDSRRVKKLIHFKTSSAAIRYLCAFRS